jgi:type IV pilus assembly protein PilP
MPAITFMRRLCVPMLAAALSAMGLSACLEIPPPKASAAPPPAPASADPAAAAAEEAQAAAYAYSPVGKRDPFRDPSSMGKVRVIVERNGQTLTALQRFEIDQLSLVFTNTATATPMAMVQDPSGRTHVVQIGDFIGKNWGKVSNIKRDELQITETIADQDGRIYPVFLPLRMKRTDESLAQEAFDLKVLANQ